MRKRKKRKIIKEHKKSLEELKKSLPKKYHPFEGISIIRYGYMGRKTITAEELE